MRIAIVSTYYSMGMGYTENCLSRALAARGHEVHLITSSLNVYGNSKDYDRTYAAFLGPADQGRRSFEVDGYAVHRLGFRLLGGYVAVPGMAAALRKLSPQIVHSTALASLQAFQLAALRPLRRFKLFTENHQHYSVVRPFLKERGHWARKATYWVTRTLPGKLVNSAMERCYAVAPDCVDVAIRFYGASSAKVKLQSLGTDTSLFRPAATEGELTARTHARRDLGIADDDLLCVYTGRFSESKNPLVLARAIDMLADGPVRMHGLFVGEGEQREQILKYRNCSVKGFMTHARLAELYRLADVAVWPREESMSMLDAAASGLPIVVSSTIGESERVGGSGMMYAENDVHDLTRVLDLLKVHETRRTLGAAARQKMCERFSWAAIAASLETDYRRALGDRPDEPQGILENA